MFLSRDAVGLLVDLSLSERGNSVARLYTAEKVVVPTFRGHKREVGPLRGHDCFSVGAGWTSGLAVVGPRTDDRRAWARFPWLGRDPGERSVRSDLYRRIAMAEFEAHWKDGRRSP